MKIGEILYNKIKEVLINKELTYNQLSKKTNRSKNTLKSDMYRMKKNKLTLNTVQAITEGLDKDVDVIIKLVDK